MIRHIDQEKLDEAAVEIRLHGDIDKVAGALRVEPDDLRRLLPLQRDDHQPVHASEDVDLWAADRLDDVL